MEPPLPVSTPRRSLAGLLPSSTVRTHRVIPLRAEDQQITVGTASRLSSIAEREIAFLTGRSVEIELVEEALLDAFIEENYPALQADAAGEEEAVVATPVHVAATSEGAAVHQVDRLIREAISMRASDIHVEPYENFFRLRYRLDGVLHTVGELALLQRDAIISRLKIMASLDIAERRRPQDGRIRYRFGERTIDLRVSTLPTDFGEKVVLRILDKSGLNLDLGTLGFDETDLALFRSAISLPYGMILVTGPTGSGKTTTLYAALNALNRAAVNIVTIEDPIEYNLPGINQVHVRSDIGFTFAQALRAFLRQDPNIIMVGEIRDAETAGIAIRAALTGHLVLSTIHTNDAPSTVSRLSDMGVEPFLVGSSVRLVVAQRLVRRICATCKHEEAADRLVLEQLGIEATHRPLYRGLGCRKCGNTGYRGRTAVFEIMPIDEALGERIGGRIGLEELRRSARSRGMRTLRERAVEKMLAGETTPEEVLRETTN